MARILLWTMAWMMVVGAGPLIADDDRQINWIGSFEAALAEAGKRKAPILLAINHAYDSKTEREKHRANREMALVGYRHPDVVKITRDFVCVIAGIQPRPADARGENSIYPHFGKITFSELMKVTTTVRDRYFDGKTDFPAPQHLLLDSRGRVFDRFYLNRKPKDFIKLLKESLARFHDDAPLRRISDDGLGVIKALKSRKRVLREAAFEKALELISAEKEDGSVHSIHKAAVKYLKSQKDFTDFQASLERITTAGSRGALSLLIPLLNHKKVRTRCSVLEVFVRSKPFKVFVKPMDARVKAEKTEEALKSLVKVLDRYADSFALALPSLSRLVSHKQSCIKVLATLAAARPGNNAIYKKLLGRSKKGSNLLVRIASILGLGKMNAKEALPTLERVRKKEKRNRPLIKALDIVIAQLGGSASREETAKALTSEIERVKREALSSGRDDDNRPSRDGTGGRGSPPGARSR